MPKRPRQHQLDSDSRKALEVLLPSEWVFRSITPDYGIDAEVEIFDATEQTTGLKFLTQLKGTDRKGARGRTCTLRYDTLRYYASLSDPVLIVLFCSDNSKVYHRWSFAVEPYYGRKGTKTLTFHFSDNEAWASETPETLRSDVAAFRRIKAPALLPMVLTLTITEKEVFGVPAAQMEWAVVEAAAELPGLLRIQPGPDKGYERILINRTGVHIILGGIPCFTLRTQTNRESVAEIRVSPFDVLIGLAIAFGRLGHNNLSAPIAAAFADRSEILSDRNVAEGILKCASLGHRLEDCLTVAQAFLRRGDLKFAAELLTILVLSRSSVLQDPERALVDRFLREYVSLAESKGDAAVSAAAHYTHAGFLRASQHYREAVGQYHAAARLNPSYCQRSYFWQELAGCLFETGHFLHATASYNRALTLGAQGECRALYADGLMFAGLYEEALGAFSAFLEVASEPNPMWVLKKLVLTNLLQTTGIRRQRRSFAEALNAAAAVPTGSPEYHKDIEAVLHLDALCGLAWFNRGVSQNAADNRNAAFMSFLTAAVSHNKDLEAWCNALALALRPNEGRIQFFPLIVAAAYWVNGEHFREGVLKIAADQGNGFPLAEFLNIVNAVMKLLPPPAHTMLARFFESDELSHAILLTEGIRCR